MKRFTYIAALSAALLLTVDAQAALHIRMPWSKKKAQTETAVPAPKKTPYQKFVSKKGVEKLSGFVNIYQDGEKVFLEIADSLMGTRIIQSTVVTHSDHPAISEGAEMSSNAVYQLDRTDSLILFLKPSARMVFKDGDTCAVRALSQSGRDAIVFAFPIKYRTDSTYVIDATKVFDPSDKKVIRPHGPFEDVTIHSAEYKADKSMFEGIRVFGMSVGVSRMATHELELASAMGILANRPVCSATYLTTLTPLPESDFTTIKADTRVGTATSKVKVFSTTGGIKTEKMASRWNLAGDRKIRIFVDNAFPETWRKAVVEGLDAWNVAFVEAGMGTRIEIASMPGDIVPGDPMVSKVMLSNGGGKSPFANLLTSDNGEILSCRITVPGDYIEGVRSRCAYIMPDIDPRFRTASIPDDAVCDVLKADIIQVFGLCLGLDHNMAGSYAYSPAQLRDPAFTQANGITASVTDQVLFNYLAQPGDRERGVVTYVDRIGSYDKYAIAWLYAGAPVDPTQLFIAPQSYPVDPRGRADDLGNDPIAAFNATRSHLAYTAANATKWLSRDDVGDSYRTLFIDWIFLAYSSASFNLMCNVGGMYTSDLRNGVSGKKFTPVPADFQRECFRTVFEGWRDVEWMDSKELLTLAGANKNLTDFTAFQTFNLSGIVQRFGCVARCEQETGSDYGVRDFMDDVEKYVFKDALAGKFSPMDQYMLNAYIQWLVLKSPVLKSNYVAASKGGRTNFADDFTMAGSGVSEAFVEGQEVLGYEYLQRARTLLKRARGAMRNAEDRGKIDYLLTQTDDAFLGRDK